MVAAAGIPVTARAQEGRRVEVGGTIGAWTAHTAGRQPGESSRELALGVRADARLLQAPFGLLGVAAFWDQYAYDRVEYLCDGPCCVGPCLAIYPPPEFTPITVPGVHDVAARLGGGLTLQLPAALGLHPDGGFFVGRFARAQSVGKSFDALLDKSTSSAFLAGQAGVTHYVGSLALGASYEWTRAWKVHGAAKPSSQRILARVAWALPIH
jgi:hypothetical protein